MQTDAGLVGKSPLVSTSWRDSNAWHCRSINSLLVFLMITNREMACFPRCAQWIWMITLYQALYRMIWFQWHHHYKFSPYTTTTLLDHWFPHVLGSFWAPRIANLWFVHAAQSVLVVPRAFSTRMNYCKIFDNRILRSHFTIFMEEEYLPFLH